MPSTTKIIWTKLHSENPVIINLKGDDWMVENESGDILALKNTRQEAIEWCYKHKCRPINTSWKVFNKMGYPKE